MHPTRRLLLSNNRAAVPSLAMQFASVLPNKSADVNGVYLPGVGQSATGGLLDAWACALAIGPNATGSGGGRPTVTAAAINGLPALLFDGTANTLALAAAALNWSKGVAGLTIGVVAKTVATATAGGVVLRLSTNASASTTRCGFNRDGSAGEVDVAGRRLDANSNQFIRDGISSTAAYTIDIGVYDYAGAKLRFYQNGTEVGTSPLDPFQTAGSSEDLASLAVTIGSNGAGATFFHGLIAGVFCIKNAQSAAVVRDIARVLGRRFAITTA